MKIRIKIASIDHSAVLEKAASVLPELVLPAELTDAMTTKEKNELLAALIGENQEKLLQEVARLLKEKEIAAAVDRITVTPELDCTLQVSRIDYSALAVKFLPLLRESLAKQDGAAAATLGTLLKLPTPLIGGVIAKMPQEKKDELVLRLMTQKKASVIKKVQRMAKKNGIALKIAELSAEA